MDSFAFIIHPIDPKRDVSRKFPRLGRILSERQINFFSSFFPPVYISDIEGVQSVATGKTIKGWFIACPLTPQRMLELPVKIVYQKIIQTGHFAERLGANLLGLGAFTSVVGDGGLTIAQALNVPVTTGDAYTVAVAIEAVQKAAEQMEIDIGQAQAAVVGATGAIGQVCAELLSNQVRGLMLIGRREDALEDLASRLRLHGCRAQITTALNPAQIGKANLVISVSSALQSIISPSDLLSGSVVCDVAWPRDVSAKVAAARPDVLVIDGGMVEVPGNVDFHFDFGFPPGKAYACMAETMALVLEGRFEDYTLGKRISRQKVEEIAGIARKHGFRLSGFRSFERAVTDEQISQVKAHVQHNKFSPVHSSLQGRPT